MTTPDTDTLAGLREELRLIGCHQNGDARCTCAIGADALDAIDALRAQAAKDKARIERLEARLAAAEAGEDALAESEAAAEGALMILVQAQAERDRRDAQMRAEGRKEGLREAAALCDPTDFRGPSAVVRKRCRDAILAAAEKGE